MKIILTIFTLLVLPLLTACQSVAQRTEIGPFQGFVVGGSIGNLEVLNEPDMIPVEPEDFEIDYGHPPFNRPSL